MTNHKQMPCCESEPSLPQKSQGESVNSSLWLGVVFLVIIAGFGWGIYRLGAASVGGENVGASKAAIGTDRLEQAVLPSDGMILPISWGDMGKQLIDSEVLNEEKFLALYDGRGGLDPMMLNMLTATGPDQIVLNQSTAPVLLNLLWAVALANENEILTKGPMMQYGDAGQFASTGGWTLASGNAMDHYAMHKLMTLTDSQQQMVERMAKNIYRPCCGNATHFPDCNHGMAMLGLLEMMASQGMSEAQMYKVALAMNSYWFPETYLTIAKYYSKQGISWNKVNATEALGNNFSSGSGYQRVLSEVEPGQSSGGGGCGV